MVVVIVERNRSALKNSGTLTKKKSNSFKPTLRPPSPDSIIPPVASNDYNNNPPPPPPPGSGGSVNDDNPPPPPSNGSDAVDDHDTTKPPQQPTSDSGNTDYEGDHDDNHFDLQSTDGGNDDDDDDDGDSSDGNGSPLRPPVEVEKPEVEQAEEVEKPVTEVEWAEGREETANSEIELQHWDEVLPSLRGLALKFVRSSRGTARSHNNKKRTPPATALTLPLENVNRSIDSWNSNNSTDYAEESVVDEEAVDETDARQNEQSKMSASLSENEDEVTEYGPEEVPEDGPEREEDIATALERELPWMIEYDLSDSESENGTSTIDSSTQTQETIEDTEWIDDTTQQLLLQEENQRLREEIYWMKWQKETFTDEDLFERQIEQTQAQLYQHIEWSE